MEPDRIIKVIIMPFKTPILIYRLKFDGFTIALKNFNLPHPLHLLLTFNRHSHIIQLTYLLIDLILNIVLNLFINLVLKAKKNKNLIPILKLLLFWPILTVQIYYLLGKYINVTLLI